MRLAHSLLGVDRPWFDLEIFDEALECAVETGSDQADSIKEMLLMANTAATGSEDGELTRIRRFLDGINEVSSDKEDQVRLSQDTIKESMEGLQVNEMDYWDDWRDASKLLDDGSTCLLYTSPSPRDLSTSRMPSSA